MTQEEIEYLQEAFWQLQKAPSTVSQETLCKLLAMLLEKQFGHVIHSK